MVRGPERARKIPAIPAVCDLAGARGPSLNIPEALVAFRENQVYERVLIPVLLRLREQLPGVRLHLLAVPVGSSSEVIREAYRRFCSTCVPPNVMVADRTVLRSMNGAVPRTVGDLDQIFSRAVSSVLLEAFGCRYNLFPEECQGKTAQERFACYTAQLRDVLRELFSIVFPSQKALPDKVCILTDELAQHLPFNFLSEGGVAPGKFLKEALVQAGVPKDRILVAKSPGTLALAKGDLRDPLLDLLEAKRVVIFGDRHTLNEGTVRQDILEAFALNTGEKRRFLASEAHLPSAAQDDTQVDQGSDVDISDVIRLVLSAFGAHRESGADSRKVSWLRFPLENLVVDLTNENALDPARRIQPEHLVPTVERQLLMQLQPEGGQGATH